ncbi:MAG: GNAT family N-acetyltransferase [Clostridia bacterium]|nr:GNAT family N-acetyltransferase [Clostridia bacterium]
MFKTLKSERLILRQLRNEDKFALYHYRSSKDNFPHVNMPIYTELIEAEVYIQKMNAGLVSGEWYIWGIEHNNKLIGTISLWNFNEMKTKAEFGFGLFPQYRHQGFMREAITVCETYGFDELNLESIEAYTSVTNPDSNTLLHKLDYNLIDTVLEDGEELNVYTKKK